MICAFTGHRPERLPWGRNEDDLRCAALKTLLRRTVREVYDRGFHTFLCGMARGCDQYFAEAVLAARADGARDAQLCALVPCPSQPDGWDEASVARYWALLAACDQLEVLEAHYSPGCMLRRNCSSPSTTAAPAAPPQPSALPKSWGSRCCRCGCERLGGRIFRRICGQRCILQCRNSS